MSFHFGRAARDFLLANLSHDKIPGLTRQEQIKKCNETEDEARALASSEGPETRAHYLRLANKWARRAAQIERDYYLLR